MIEQRDDFSIRASLTEAAERLERGLTDTRVSISHAEPERIVLRLKPSWTRNPGVVVVQLRPLEDGHLEILVRATARGRSATQRAYVLADVQKIRAALETRVPPG